MNQCAAVKTVDLVCSVNVENNYTSSTINVEFGQCNNTLSTSPVRLNLSNDNNTLECCLKSQMCTDLLKAHSNSTFCIICHILNSNTSAKNTDQLILLIGTSCTLAVLLVLFLIGTCIILCYCWIRKKRALMIPPRCNSK